MQKYIKNYSVSLISLLILTGCATHSAYNQSNQHVEFMNNHRPYLRPYQTVSLTLDSTRASLLRDMAEITSCEEGDILWTYQPNFKRGLRDFWENTEQEANLAARANGTLDAKKAVWQKFGNTFNEMRQNGTAGCSHPMTDQEYNYFMTQQNNQRYQAQQNSDNSAANINTATQGLNGLTNQLNNMNNQMQQRNNSYKGFDASKGLNFKGYGY